MFLFTTTYISQHYNITTFLFLFFAIFCVTILFLRIVHLRIHTIEFWFTQQYLKAPQYYVLIHVCNLQSADTFHFKPTTRLIHLVLLLVQKHERPRSMRELKMRLKSQNIFLNGKNSKTYFQMLLKDLPSSILEYFIQYRNIALITGQSTNIFALIEEC